MIRISELVSVDRIAILDTMDKNAALKRLIDLMATADSITDAVALEAAVYDRENLMSTSIGLGVAIPHVRLAGVSAMTIAIGVIPDGIEYQAFDEQPVTILIMIAAPEGSHREYLSVLAKIALLLKNPALRSAIRDAQSPEEVYDILKGH